METFHFLTQTGGALAIQDSTLCDNPSAGFETPGFPGIYALASGDPQVQGSLLAAACP